MRKPRLLVLDKTTISFITVAIPPNLRTLKIWKKPSYIALPWMVFRIQYASHLNGYIKEHAWVGMSYEKPKFFNGVMYPPRFGNISENGYVCMPSATGKTVLDMARATIASFFGSQFTNDVDYGRISPQQLGSLVKLTKTNPEKAARSIPTHGATYINLTP